MGYSYEIQYKSGKENVAVDALSRVDGAEFLLMAISAISSDLMTRLEKLWKEDVAWQQIIQHRAKSCFSPTLYLGARIA